MSTKNYSVKLSLKKLSDNSFSNGLESVTIHNVRATSELRAIQKVKEYLLSIADFEVVGNATKVDKFFIIRGGRKLQLEVYGELHSSIYNYINEKAFGGGGGDDDNGLGPYSDFYYRKVEDLNDAIARLEKHGFERKE